MWGIQVIIPQKLQERVLLELHQSHPGIVRMKTIAQGYFWWPKLDQDIEHLSKSCLQCQGMRNAPLLWLHFTPGSGPQSHGNKFTLILLDRSRERASSS